jgi:NitT/TauT family transport system substrate-binding protein
MLNFFKQLGWLSKLIIVSIIVLTGAYFGYPYVKGSFGAGGGNADLTGSLNTWTGFVGIVDLNGGKDVNKDSRMYKEFGLKLKIEQMDVRQNCIDALKEGKVDFIYTTTDISPTENGQESDLMKLGVIQILKIDDSRGADVIVGVRTVKNVQDLKGQKIAVAQGTASHTLLLRVLETAGLTQNDIELVKVADGIEAAKMFKAGEVPVAVVWSPDDGDCYSAITGSHEIFSTKFARNIIMDGIIVKKEVFEKKRKEFEKLAIGWLTINAELNELVKSIDPNTFTDEISKMCDGKPNSIPPRYDSIATTFSKAFNAPKFVVADGMFKVRYSTYGDNVNFFGLNSSFNGVDGDELYTKMTRSYSEIGLAKNPAPWRQVSDPSLIQGITTLKGGIHSAEGEVVFTPATEEMKTAEASSVRNVSINFDLGSYSLNDEAMDIIDKDIIPVAKGVAGGSKFRLEGNTDNTGNPQSNINLSKLRAQAVANYMIKRGINPSYIIAVVGNGSSKPLCNENTPDCYEKNRRTEFQLINR